MDRRTLIACAVAASFVVGLALPALAATPQELPKLDSRSPRNDAYGLDAPRAAGAYDLRPPALRAGTVYAAGLFPLALRLTTPGGRWLGGQGQSFRARAQPPVFGWIELLSSPAGRPRGAIFAVTAYGRTPSVVATVKGLRSRGAGVAYQPATPVRLAGFSGTRTGWFRSRPEGISGKEYRDLAIFRFGDLVTRGRETIRNHHITESLDHRIDSPVLLDALDLLADEPFGDVEHGGTRLVREAGEHALGDLLDDLIANRRRGLLARRGRRGDLQLLFGAEEGGKRLHQRR